MSATREWKGRSTMSGHKLERSRSLGSESGSALVIALMVLGMLGMLGTALVYNSVADRHVSRYERDSAEALAAAETGLAWAKRVIQDLSAPIEDADADGQPDFTLTDTLSWGGEYTVVAEAGEIRSTTGLSAYRSRGYTIVSEGRSNGALRRVRSQIAHDSFLKYARFVEDSGTGYGCRGLLTGEIYLGGDLNIPNCPSGQEVTFLEYVATTGDIPNAAAGIFMRGYVTDAPQIDLGNSVDFDEVREVARGIAADNDCGGQGVVGLYQNPGGGWNPLGLAGNTIDVGDFDFYDLLTQPGDTVVAYAGNPVVNTLTGNPLLRADFNGIIFFEGDAHVYGTMDGKSARSITIFATNRVHMDGDIVAGHTGFNPITGLPNSGGDPVNIGLVCRDDVRLGDVPRVVQFDVAMMSVEGNWRANNGGTGSHPTYVGPPRDLDMDGVIEAGINNDPIPGDGWQEMAIDSNTWCLNINGPIITHDGGSAAPWSGIGGAPGPTRRYNYDLDVTEFPPPCYPVPLNLWIDVSWTEVFEAETPLWDLLP